MKNEIIIDGTDVSGCEFYCEEYCNLSNDRNERLPFAEKCTEYSDCCYKQLKRKKQECEELKEDYAELEKENGELKAENFAFEGLVKDQEEMLDDNNVIIERFLMASGKSKDLTQPDEFEEVFEDIEQTYSEYEELEKECEQYRIKLNNIQDRIDLFFDTKEYHLNPDLADDIQDILYDVRFFNKFKQELKEIKKEFQIECLEDITTGKRTYRSTKLLNYKRLLDEIYDTVANNSVINKEDILNKIDEVKRQ